MKFLLTAAGIFFFSLAPLFLPAQEIGYMDLTDNIFRERSAKHGQAVVAAAAVLIPPTLLNPK